MKRIANAASAANKSKSQSVPIVESGTSVAPRQRPKGSSAAHIQHPLTLGLPPSPSPRNNITSPQPQPVVEQFQTNFPVISAPSQTSSQLIATTPVAAAPSAPAPTVNPIEVVSSTTVSASTLGPNIDPVLDSLFESSYPDPFSESVASTISNADTSATDPTTVTTDDSTDQTLNDTPKKTLLSPPKSNGSGHRRNVSDTSAFNK